MSTTGGLIGRDPVLAVVRDSLGQAAAGQGHLVLIGGEAGIGKSAVAAAAAGQAAAEGAMVLWGRCSYRRAAAPGRVRQPHPTRRAGPGGCF
jgi:predicted ATPase